MNKIVIRAKGEKGQAAWTEAIGKAKKRSISMRLYTVLLSLSIIQNLLLLLLCAALLFSHGCLGIHLLYQCCLRRTAMKKVPLPKSSSSDTITL